MYFPKPLFSTLALGALLAAPASLAQPTLSFEDAGGSVTPTYNAGGTFDLNLSLTYAAADLTPGDPSDDVVGEVAFDLGLEPVTGSNSAGGVAITNVSGNGPFGTVFDSTRPLDLNPVSTRLDFDETNPIGLAVLSSGGALPGTAVVGTYSFSIDANTPLGTYRLVDAIALDSVNSLPAEIVSGTSFAFAEATIESFTFEVVPEPTTAALLLPVLASGIVRRRRA